MAILTGILGSKGAQPGLIQPGAVGTGGQDVTESVAVLASIAFDVAQGPWKRLVDSVGVTPTIHLNRDRAITRLDTATVGQGLVTFAAVARVTRYAIETVYRKAPAVALTHAISVTPEFHRFARLVPVSVSHGIVVAQDEVPGPTLHKNMVDVVHVGQVCAGRNTNVRIGVTTQIGCGTPTLDRDDHDRESVSDSILVAAHPTPSSNQIGIHITDTVSFRLVLTHTTNPLKIFLADLITVTDSVGGGRGDREILHIDQVRVATTANPKRPTAQVRHDLVVSKNEAGGGGQRRILVQQPIAVADAAAGRSSGNHQAFEDRLVVAHVRFARGPIVAATFTDAIAVRPAIIGAGPKRLAAADAVHVATAQAPVLSINRQFLFDSVQVALASHQNFASASVSHAVHVTARPSTKELGVTSRIGVSQSFRKNFDAHLVDTLPITYGLSSPRARSVTIVDPLPVAGILTRRMIWTRTFTDALAIPEFTFKRRTFLPDPIDVPVASGGLVTKYTTLASKNLAIILPRPLLGDGLDNVDSVLIHRSMNAKALVFKRSSGRRRLRLTFRLDKAKAFEMRMFVEASLSEVITLTTFDAQVWLVQIPRNPFEIQHAGRSAKADEFALVELELEGTKISG